MSLVSLEDMKSYLDIPVIDTDYDVFLQEQLDLYSSAVESYCGRKILADDYTQIYYKDDLIEDFEPKLPLYHYPINSIASVEEITSSVGVDTLTTALSAYQYRVHNESGMAYRIECGRKRSWFGGLSYETRIEIAYNAGYAATPLEIDSTIKSLVEERYNKKTSGVALGFGSDVQRVAIPGTISVDFDYSLQANERDVRYGMLLGNYVNNLDPFRSERVLIGSIRDNYVS